MRKPARLNQPFVQEGLNARRGLKPYVLWMQEREDTPEIGREDAQELTARMRHRFLLGYPQKPEERLEFVSDTIERETPAPTAAFHHRFLLGYPLVSADREDVSPAEVTRDTPTPGQAAFHHRLLQPYGRQPSDLLEFIEGETLRPNLSPSSGPVPPSRGNRDVVYAGGGHYGTQANRSVVGIW